MTKKSKSKILEKLPQTCECGHPLDWAVPRKTANGLRVYNCDYCRKEYVLRP